MVPAEKNASRIDNQNIKVTQFSWIVHKTNYSLQKSKFKTSQPRIRKKRKPEGANACIARLLDDCAGRERELGNSRAELIILRPA